MLIRYRHISDPDIIKTFDTVKAFKKHPASFTDKRPTQDEYDEFTMAKFEEDFQNGIILEYEKLIYPS